MLGRLYEAEDCSAARALELVGERWTLLILRDAMFRHHTRFSQFQSELAIAPNILAKRLATLVAAGIFEVERQEYLLTERGRSLLPVLVALTRWGDRWISAGPVRIVHAGCGTEVEHPIRCPHCADAVEPVDPVDVDVRPRSAAEREALDAHHRSLERS